MTRGIFFAQALVGLTLASYVHAEIELLAEPIAVTTEIPQWVARFKEKFGSDRSGIMPPPAYSSYMECREVAEINSTFLCFNESMFVMNRALARASMFVEGLENVEKGTVVEHSDDRLGRVMRYAGGHDLRSDDLMEFYKAAHTQCALHAELCLNQYEEEIFNKLIVPKAERGDFVLITFAYKSLMSISDVVTHEIMHAQYFMQPKYAEVVDLYWASMSDSDRSNIKSYLGRHYDQSNDLLMRNEFQAYMLMVGAQFSLLSPFVNKYRPSLWAKLKDAGVEPVQVKL
jgi:hypothetical protein